LEILFSKFESDGEKVNIAVTFRHFPAQVSSRTWSTISLLLSAFRGRPGLAQWVPFSQITFGWSYESMSKATK
jgi:hypothetical protein